MKYKEIKDIVLPESKRKDEKISILDNYISRPLSIIFTKPFINTNVKPTTITKWSVLFCLISFILIAFFSNFWIKILGWIFLFLWVIFDGVDGNLARCKNQCSQLGDLWDTMGGYLAMITIYFSAGIAAFYADNLIFIVEDYWYIIFGGFTAILSIFPRLIMQKKKTYNLDSDVFKEFTDKKNFGFKQIVMQNLISPSGFVIVFLLIGIIFNLLNIFIIGYMLINMAFAFVSLYMLLKE